MPTALSHRDPSFSSLDSKCITEHLQITRAKCFSLPSVVLTWMETFYTELHSQPNKFHSLRGLYVHLSGVEGVVTSFEDNIYAISSFLLWDGHLSTQAKIFRPVLYGLLQCQLRDGYGLDMLSESPSLTLSHIFCLIASRDTDIPKHYVSISFVTHLL